MALEVTVADVGLASAVTLERSVDAGPWQTIGTCKVEAGPELAVDTFTRPDNVGSLGNEESVNARAWDEADVGSTGYAIDNLAATLDGPGKALLSVGEDDVRVGAVVGVNPPSGVIARFDPTSGGFVSAVLTPDDVTLEIFDGVAVYRAESAPVDLGGADRALLELAVSGDDYAAYVNDELKISFTDAGAPALGSRAGITGAGNSGLSVFHDFDVEDISQRKVVETDLGAPKGVDVEYRATPFVLDPSLDVSTVSPTVTAPAAVDTSAGWSLGNPATGTAALIEPEAVSFSQARPGQVTVTNGVSRGEFGTLSPRVFNMSVRAIGLDAYKELRELVATTGPLALADVFGATYRVVMSSAVNWQQVPTIPLPGETSPVGHHHIATFTVTEVTG